MKKMCLTLPEACFIFLLIFGLFFSAGAQLISIKTVPLAEGDQFMLFPSQNFGMGNPSIALDDSLLDPFVNPAKTARMTGMRLFGAPTYYSISDNNGSARTLPFGILYGSKAWFGGISLSLQQLKSPEQQDNFIQPLSSDQSLLSEKYANNTYFYGSLGKNFLQDRLAVAASIFYAELNALQGLEMLYPNSRRVEQNGNTTNFRLGLYGQLKKHHNWEAVFLYSKFDMSHNVYYSNWIWDGIAQQGFIREIVEKNKDRTDTWGLHLGYTRPLSSEGWRVGGMITANYKTHPKIPNYELMNIPRDPGNSKAFNFGIGVSNQQAENTLAFDFVYEPIWSRTWAEASEPVISAGGFTIRPGEKTVDNDFDFSNSIIRLGIQHNGENTGFQLGIAVHSISYELRQKDYVNQINRKQKEHWTEWSPSWGLIFKFPGLHLYYVGRLTVGTGRPGVADAWFGGDKIFAYRASDILLAPSGALTLQDAVVFTNQVAVSIPIRN